MSEDDSTSYESELISDNYTFVRMLSKYKIIFEKHKTPDINRKKNQAALAMVEEFRQKCRKKLTVRQIFKKMRGIKQRLKEKNYKNLSRRKQMPYQKWERMFLELWVGNGISIPNKHEKKTHSDNNSSQKSLVLKEPLRYKTPEEIIRNFEADYNMLEDDTHTSSENSSQEWEPEPEVSSKKSNDDKRAALISQIKILKVQEAVARTEEKVNIYKLSILQQNKVVKSEN